MTVLSSRQLKHYLHLDLDLVMATVGLGKDHEKENILKIKDNDIRFRDRRRNIPHFLKD